MANSRADVRNLSMYESESSRRIFFRRLDRKVDGIVDLQAVIYALTYATPTDVVARELRAVQERVERSIDPSDPARLTFVTHLQAGVQALITLNQRVHAYHGKPHEMNAALLATPDRTHVVLTQENVRDAIYSAFHILFFVSPRHAVLHCGQERGRAVKGTPFIFVSANDVHRDEVVNHEIAHTLLEGPEYFSVPKKYYPHQRVEEIIVDQLRQEEGQESVEQRSSRERMEALEHISDVQMLDAMHNELLAELQPMIRRRMKDPLDFLPGIDQPLTIDAVDEYGSAGYMLFQMSIHWNRLERRTADLQLSEYAAARKQRVERRILSMLNGLYESIGIARAVEAVPQLVAAAHILKPSQYRFLPLYLQHRYGARATAVWQSQRAQRISVAAPGSLTRELFAHTS